MIREVYIENIKSYKSQKITFTKGLNAIIGENGAGKSTILESIGFALFNSLPYNISDFIRRGELKGEIRIKFESPADGRVYRIVRRIDRDRTAEYYVEDLELGRIAEGVKDVKGWVRNHLGLDVEPEVVFENAIGVNQGNITSHFLLPPSARENVFSPLLGIEKYKRAFEKSRDYENFLKDRLTAVEKEILRIEEKIKNLERQKDELLKRKGQVEALRTEKEKLEKELSSVVEEFREMEKLEKEIERLENEKKIVQNALDFNRSELSKVESRLKAIDVYEAEIATLKEHYESYLKLNDELSGLESEIEKLENRIGELEKTRDVLLRTEERYGQLRAEIENKKKRLENYKEVRKKASIEETLKNKLNEIERAESELKSKIRIVDDYRERLKKLESELEDIKKTRSAREQLLKALNRLEGIEEKRDRLREVLGNLEQRKNTLEKTIEKIGSGVCPILNESCERVRGERVKQERELEELTKKMEDIRKKLAKAEELVSKKIEIEKRLSLITQKLEKEDELSEEIGSLREKLEEERRNIRSLEGIISGKDEVVKELENVEGSQKELAVLERLREEVELKVRELADIHRRVLELRVSLGHYDEMRKRLDMLRGMRRELNSKVEGLREKYDRYLYLSGIVKEKKPLLEKKSELETTIEKLEKDYGHITDNLANLYRKFDREKYDMLNSRIEKLRSSIHEKAGEIRAIESMISRIERELEVLEELERDFEKLSSEKEKTEKKLEFVRDLREIFRKAVPELARVYSEVISADATRIFCEIMDDYSWQIEWKEDYGIRAKYMGRDIDFRQMSGGEQMVAAIAVRLALLKVLSSTSFIFLDEPTQNMDADRRRNLAQQISKISDFKQIFVISHDDTFEEMVENAIRVRKENGVSVV